MFYALDFLFVIISIIFFWVGARYFILVQTRRRHSTGHVMTTAKNTAIFSRLDHTATMQERSDSALVERYHRLRDDFHIQQKILQVSNAILAGGASVATLEEAFTLTLETCQQAFGGDTSVIELLDDEGKELVGVATDRQPYHADGYFRIPLTESALSTIAFNSGHTVGITDVIHDPRVSQRIRKIFNARSGIATPLIIDKRPIGILMTMMQHVHQEFTSRDYSVLEGLAAVAALAVHTQILHKSRIQLEHRFQRLVEMAPSAIFVIDNDYRIVESNRAVSKLFGYPDQFLNGRDFEGLFNPEFTDKLHDYSAKSTFDSAITFESEMSDVSGIYIPVEINMNRLTIVGRPVIQAFVRDIRARKAAQEALREAKEHAEITLRSIGEAVITTDIKGYVKELNPAGETLVEVSRELARGKPICDVLRIVDEYTDAPIDNPVKACLSSNTELELTEHLAVIKSDGLRVGVEMSISPIRDSAGKAIGTVTVIHDVSHTRCKSCAQNGETHGLSGGT